MTVGALGARSVASVLAFRLLPSLPFSVALTCAASERRSVSVMPLPVRRAFVTRTVGFVRSPPAAGWAGGAAPTVTVAVAGSLVPLASVAVKLKDAAPVKPAAGVKSARRRRRRRRAIRRWARR